MKATPRARRALAAYILSVVVTCSLGATLTYRLLQQNLETDAQARLLEDARVYGLAVFSRLENADRILEWWLNSRSIQPGAEIPAVQPPTGSPVTSVSLVRLDVPADDVDPDETRSRSRELAAMAERSTDGGTLRDSTIVFAHEGSKAFPVLVRQVPGMNRFFAVGWIRPEYIWGGRGMLPEGVQLCMEGPRGIFRVCRPGEDQTGPADARLTARWPLFLRARFGIDAWSIEASQSRSLILAPLSGIQLGAASLAGAVLLLTVFLGSAFIRGGFGPLERLLANWEASKGKPGATAIRAPVQLGQLSTSSTSSGVRLERSRRVLDALTELDRKILLAGSLEATVLWLLPRIAAELDASAVAVIFTATREEETGTLYVATQRSPPSCSVCDVSFHSVRKLMESDGRVLLANLEGAPFTSLRQEGFSTSRAYPIRDEKHLVGALLLLDPPEEVAADTDRQGLAFSDRLSVAVSHWRRKEELTRATYFDSLTGLANRELLLERLARVLADSVETRALAVMLIGFDGLENVNTTLGYRAGDELLRLAAQRIGAIVRETETLARLTGNRLALLVPNLDEPASAALAAQRIVALFEKPFLADGLSYVVSVSIGIAVSPADGLTSEGLIRSAETAMRRAKSGSAGRITFFEEVMNDHTKRRIWLEHGLRGAMGTHELQLYYQPKVELGTQRVIGAEALLRWMHPTAGPISPAEFVPTAEASGLIVPIGQWALEESCRQLLEWRREGIHLEHIAVNLSLRQLQDAAFLQHLLRYVSEMGADARSLELEVTESVFAEQPAQLSRTLEQIRSRGVRIAIDDFGTGYSSLAILQLLPFDVLKIDRAFVSGISSGTGDAIVKAIIAMGMALGKDLVAEGIETEAQARALEHCGCSSAQGFYFAPALPAAEFIRYFHEHRGLSKRGLRARRA
jgi:diguanylate cyclase (GGDEF)-like protein